MPVSEETYKRLSLEDDEHKWELVCGHLRRKPPTTHSHADVTMQLAFILGRQLNRSEYRVRVNHSRTRVNDGSYFVPDLAVIPYQLTGPKLGSMDELEEYTAALPLVAEGWSKSTGEYDVTEKLPEYQRRGDAEIWLIHPYERTVAVWRRQADGSYDSTMATSGTLRVGSLPNVTVDLAELFDS